MQFLGLAALLAMARLGSARFAAVPLAELMKPHASTERLATRELSLADRYPAYNLSVPIDHFHNETQYEPHSNGSYNLRYWFDDTYYKPGGPVIIFEGGEAAADDRLPILQKGIVAQLSQATNGLGVIIEHRYYGTSMPTPDLSVKNLRFLTTDQALADVVYFAKHVVFKGHEHDQASLRPGKTPWIAYGGSYSGAFVSFLRKLYPDVFFGAISSSGVTEAIYDYWGYFEPVRKTGEPTCIQGTQFVTDVVDQILIHNKSAVEIKKLKQLFGLEQVVDDRDFANGLTGGIYGWQSQNWDPEINDLTVPEYCANLTATSLSHPQTAALEAQVKHVLQVAGYDASNKTLVRTFQNYVGYVNETAVSTCADSDKNACFATSDPAAYAQDDLSQTWRSWPWQYCTQWGFLQTGSVPANQKPLISRTIDIKYTSIICREAFNITTPSDVEAVNKHGGYAISYPRLAIIDGRRDPWREATPHADAAPSRTSTASEPFFEISDGIHHWDENGIFANETTATLPPKPVAQAQQSEAAFVKAWLKDFVPC